MITDLKQLGLLLALCVSIGQAQAHAVLPVLPHHSPLLAKVLPTKPAANTKILASLLSKSRGATFNPIFAAGLSGSGAARSLQLQARTIATAAYTSGQNSVSASALASAIANGGSIQGDFYLQFPPASTYTNIGVYNFSSTNFPFSGGLVFSVPGGATLTPGFVNSLSFSNATFSTLKVGFMGVTPRSDQWY